MFILSADAIDREKLIARLKDTKAGALVVFEGWVRNQNEGKAVRSLEYQVYAELAQKEGERILHEATHKFNLHHVECTHRFGHLHLGDTAVWIGAIASHRDDAFKATRYVIDEIKLRLPIWKKEHYVEKEAEWVFCKHHHTHVHFKAEEYYQKQIRLTKQDILARSRVLVIGAGGLGCPVLISLATAGVGHVEIVDFDKISISNIHRQPLYSPDLVGERKAVVAQKKLSALNPFIHVHSHVERIGSANIEDYLKGKDLIIDCTDNMETKYLIHDACFKNRVPLVSASIFQFEGQVRTFDPENQSGCLRCLLDDAPDDANLGNCNDFGVLGAAVSIIGSIEANEALSFLQERQNSTVEQTFYLNTKTLTQMKIKNKRKPECSCCEGTYPLKVSDLEVSVSELHALQARLVDLRDKEDSIIDQFKEGPEKVVLYCHRGIRSKRLVKELREQGYDHFYSLTGGACSL